MLKKRKKILAVFIALIIAVLLFSVVGIITVYISGGTAQQAAQDAYIQELIQEELALSGSILTGENVVVSGSTVSITGEGAVDGVEAEIVDSVDAEVISGS